MKSNNLSAITILLTIITASQIYSMSPAAATLVLPSPDTNRTEEEINEYATTPNADVYFKIVSDSVSSETEPTAAELREILGKIPGTSHILILKKSETLGLTAVETAMIYRKFRIALAIITSLPNDLVARISAPCLELITAMLSSPTLLPENASQLTLLAQTIEQKKAASEVDSQFRAKRFSFK